MLYVTLNLTNYNLTLFSFRQGIISFSFQVQLPHTIKNTGEALAFLNFQPDDGSVEIAPIQTTSPNR